MAGRSGSWGHKHDAPLIRRRQMEARERKELRISACGVL
jgi:hypothetical protein